MSPLPWTRRGGSAGTRPLVEAAPEPPPPPAPTEAALDPGGHGHSAGPLSFNGSPASGGQHAPPVTLVAEDNGAALRRQEQRLVRANLALVRQLRPGGALQWAVNDVRTIVGAAYAAVLLCDAPGGGVGTFVHSGLARGASAEIGAGGPEARGLLGLAMKSGGPMRLRDLRSHPAFSGFPEGHPGMTSFVCAPLRRRREVVGLVFATDKRRAAEFNRDDERFVARMAAELSRSRLLSPEKQSPELVDRIAASSEALNREMAMTRLFLSSLSHELRGSIAGIMVSAELLGDPSLGVVDTDHVRALGGRIHSVAANLLALVDNLLDLGRLEAGRLDVRLQPVDLRDVVDDVAAVVGPLADAAGITVDWPQLAEIPRVVADPIRLRQVLVNLLGNALKFTPSGERAWLEAESVGSRVQFAVCDTGRGIPVEDHERIFEPFQRGGDTRAPGVGLGLAICRHIVELHGSGLELQSEPGKGSRFWFSLRRSREPLPPRLLRSVRGDTVVGGVNGGPASVLVVEDDPVSRQSVSDVLSAAGYLVRTTVTQAGALEAITKAACDVVVLDIQLPDGSGLDIVDRLRGAVAHPLAIVAVSADRLGDVEERAMRAGCDRFALKPMPAHDLLHVIVEAVESRRTGAGSAAGPVSVTDPSE